MVSVLLLPKAQRDLDKLDPAVLRRILEEFHSLARNPRPAGSLKLTDEEGYRIRVGDMRILYRIDDRAKTIFVYRMKRRDEAYRR